MLAAAMGDSTASPSPRGERTPIHRVGASRERIVGAAVSPAFSAHGIVLAGITDAASDYEFARSRPPRCQLLACVAGRGRVLVDGAWAVCTPGSIYATPMDVPHAYKADGSRGWRICWVMYSRPVVRVAAPTLIIADGAPLFASIEGLHAEARGANDARVIRRWTELMQAQVDRVLGLSRDGSRLWPVWRACDDDLGRRWTLGELARLAAVSPEHLRRLCHSELGRSPMRQLAYLRLRSAATILALETVTIEAMAERLGYANPFAFSSAFKRLTGLSPTTYRGLLRSGKNPPVW